MAKSKAVLASGLSRKRFKVGEARETVLNEICPTAHDRFPYYFRLPYNSPLDLLKWRRYVRERCIHDLKFRAAIWEAGRRDFAFFCVTFLWIFEPRPNPRRLPFFLYTDQVSLASWFVEIFGERDGAVNKTRGIGLSWLVAAFIYWKWTYEPEVKIAMLTKDKDLLDSGDSNSSIGKLQYLHDNMPTWAKYTKSGRRILTRTSEQHFFLHNGHGALVQGFVSTSTKLRQLRFTWLFADEFAFYDRTNQTEWMTSSAGTVNSRLFVSTWNDFDDEFHRIFYEEESSLLKMSAYWWNNYDRWRGAYKMEAGRPVLIDLDYKHEKGYQFGEPGLLDDGTVRSPWVDAELSRPGVDKIATLRDLFGMSVCERTNSFFSGEVRSAVRETLCEPALEGRLHHRNGKVTVEPTKKSEIRLWADPEAIRKRGPLTCFCDLGGGSGLAYSVASFLDRSGRQVCEYGTNTVGITDFAANVVHVARWLCGIDGDGWCTIDFDNIGPLSKSFVAEVLRLAYGNLWMSEIIDAKARKKKLRMGELPTYYGTTNRDGGMKNFRELARAVMEMECVVHSDRVMDDLGRCSRDAEKEGMPKFAKPTGNRGHGDFLQALAGAWWRLRSTVDLEARDNSDSENPTEIVYNEWSPPDSQIWSAQYAA